MGGSEGSRDRRERQQEAGGEARPVGRSEWSGHARGEGPRERQTLREGGRTGVPPPTPSSSSQRGLPAPPTPRQGFRAGSLRPLGHQSQHDGAICCEEGTAQLTPLKGLRIWGGSNSHLGDRSLGSGL